MSVETAREAGRRAIEQLRAKIQALSDEGLTQAEICEELEIGRKQLEYALYTEGAKAAQRRYMQRQRELVGQAKPRVEHTLESRLRQVEALRGEGFTDEQVMAELGMSPRSFEAVLRLGDAPPLSPLAIAEAVLDSAIQPPRSTDAGELYVSEEMVRQDLKSRTTPTPPLREAPTLRRVTLSRQALIERMAEKLAEIRGGNFFLLDDAKRSALLRFSETAVRVLEMVEEDVAALARESKAKRHEAHTGLFDASRGRRG